MSNKKMKRTLRRKAETMNSASATTPEAQFRINKITNKKSIWSVRYSDDPSTTNRCNRAISAGGLTDFSSAASVRKALEDAISNRRKLTETSRKLYATNPLYANIINYYCNLFLWRYKVIPHKIYKKTASKRSASASEKEFSTAYNLMLEVVDGLAIETLFPKLLQTLFLDGAVYFTTVCNTDQILIDTIRLPDRYCRKIGETQYGTNIIQMDMSYFQDLRLSDDDLKDYLESYSDEIAKAYKKYLNDSSLRWVTLDPRYSSCVMLNEYSIPTLFYVYGGILNYEQYQENELQRNENLLKYIVVQTMPIYQDRLIFENDEVKELHQSMKKVIDRGEQARLLTTYGDVKVERIAEDESAQDEVLEKALQSLYDNGGINPTLFIGDSEDALKDALIRDQGMVWRYIQQMLNFYTIAINNWFDFKSYQADIEILRVSPYTYSDDISVFKNNATLGVGKLDYVVASGIKQKNIIDTLTLEDYLGLNDIKPMQTSYTQTAQDRDGNNDDSDSNDSNDSGGYNNDNESAGDTDNNNNNNNGNNDNDSNDENSDEKEGRQPSQLSEIEPSDGNENRSFVNHQSSSENNTNTNNN